MNYNNPKLRQMLASEYVLGTLRGPARQRFERLLRDDMALQRLVVEWQQHLTPLDYTLAPVEPPPHVWQKIEARIAPQARRTSLWQSLNFWRGLGLVASALALALVVLRVMAPQQIAPQPSYLAVLNDERGQATLVVSAREQSNEIVISVLTPIGIEPGKTLELWSLPAQGNPRSLGLVPASGGAVLQLRAPARTAFDGVPALAISVEPRGGSPTGLPTGPVLYQGAFVRL